MKNAQRALGEVVRWKEDAAAGKKRKQAVMHELLTPCAKTSAESSSQEPGSKELDAKLESYICVNGIAFNTEASSSFALMIEYEVRQTKSASKFARQNPLQRYLDEVPHRLKF